jgi:hypothetical protein
MRFGYFARGIVYVIPGWLAFQLALGVHGAEMTQTGAIGVIGHQPFGRVLLVVMAVGLAGYVLWGVVRVVFDPLEAGHSPRGLARRIGFASSGLAYAGLLLATVQILAGSAAGRPAADWTVGLLARPYGAWLVGIFGVAWIAGGGIGEIVRGARGMFERDLAFERMGRAERGFAKMLGRLGIITRGVVFTVIGGFLVATALHANPHHASGMDGALLGIAREPFGRVLLGASALGLVGFGLYSMMCARWMRMRDAARSLDSRSPNPPPA